MARNPIPPVTHTDIRLKVLGVGGAGGNAVSQIAGTLAGIEMIAINTDLQALNGITGLEKLPIGSAVTRGLGAGGDAETGARATQQDAERLEAVVHNTNIIFLVTGLGGGTGTGASPVIARIAKEQGAMVLAFAALPFAFEGDRRRQQALTGLDQLRAQTDAVICIPNDKLQKLTGEDATAIDVFRHGNEIIATGVQAIWQLLSRKGLINLDFADVRNALGGKHGDGIFSFGDATGANKSRDAIKALMDNPLLDGGETLAKAEGVLVSVLGGPEMTVSDVQRAVEPISRLTTRAQVIFGAAVDENYQDRISVTVLATTNLQPRRAPQPVAGRAAIGRTSPLRAPTPGTPKTAAKKEVPQAKQETLPLEGVTRGRFDKSEPTLHDGQDLDVPTYLRRGVSLKR
jgi:cell division protein FtsZ